MFRADVINASHEYRFTPTAFTYPVAKTYIETFKALRPMDDMIIT